MRLPVRLVLLALAGALGLTGCVSIPAPQYQPSVETTGALLRNAPGEIQVGAFDAAQGVRNKGLGVRGSTLQPGGDGTFSGYLRDALKAELAAAGKSADDAPVRITGTLTKNILNGDGIKVGKATIAARFRVERSGVLAYNRELSIDHTWESSFLGPIAIPAAFDNYTAAVQKLVQSLLTDPAFVEASRPEATP